ncbi:MAG: hypothetical protein ABI306_07210 [Caulobacteraceae bacterium]
MADRKADIETWTTRRGAAYLAEHPLVERMVSSPDSDEEGESVVLRIWTRTSTADPVEPDLRPAPGRPHDVEFSGDNLIDADFWERCPRMQYAEFFRELMGDEVYPRGWWHVRLWLTDQPAEVRE